MYILGIFSFVHDSAACLISDALLRELKVSSYLNNGEKDGN